MSNNSPKRCAIVGTAQSWTQTPWDDPGMVIKTLNDGYSLGIPRTSEHYDIHPFDLMWFRPKDKRTFTEGEIPKGVYVRPEGHLDWLRERAKTIPVWLQDDPPADWPINARRFPMEAVRQWLQARPDQDGYIASSPVLMFAHAVLEGYQEIHIYGIHLATEAEYIKQRPNMEYAIGKAEGMGIQIVIPESCPLLKHSHVYAYEREPVKPDRDARQRFAEAQQQYAAIASQLIGWPRWKSKTKELNELRRLQAVMADAKQAAHYARVTAGAA